MGTLPLPEGQCYYEYADGRIYSGHMRTGLPHGFGIQLGPEWCYYGRWEYGVLTRGRMIRVDDGSKFKIPFRDSMDEVVYTTWEQIREEPSRQ